MNEISKYGVYKEKLEGLCDKHDLSCSICNKGCPFTLTIKPQSGMDAQQTMMEGMGDSGTGYINPDASLVFVYKDGELSYKISEAFSINESLFNKIKNLFKNLYSMWMQYFYRDIYECNPSAAPENRPKAEDEPVAEDFGPEMSAGEEDCPDELGEFLEGAEPAVEDADTEGEE